MKGGIMGADMVVQMNQGLDCDGSRVQHRQQSRRRRLCTHLLHWLLSTHNESLIPPGNFSVQEIVLEQRLVAAEKLRQGADVGKIQRLVDHLRFPRRLDSVRLLPLESMQGTTRARVARAIKRCLCTCHRPP